MNNRKIYYYVGGFVVSLVIVLTTLEVMSQLYYYNSVDQQHNDNNMYVFDEELGWKLVDGSYTQIHRDFKAVYNIRNLKRLTINKSQSSKNINFYGDSFCFGIGVSDQNTIPSIVSSKTNMYSVKNYGVSGFGPLQYLLRSQKISNSKDINVFLIFTGNDYRDIQRDSIEWGPGKPTLIQSGESYGIKYPVKDQYKNVSNTYKFKFRTLHLIKKIAKSIPFVVNIYSKLSKPDVKYVEEAINRFDYLYKNVDKDNNIFVVLPSVSLVSGISVNSNEGYFKQRLTNYLKDNSFHFIDMSEAGLIDDKQFFWETEGHNNEQGNRVIASKILNYITSNINQEQLEH